MEERLAWAPYAAGFLLAVAVRLWLWAQVPDFALEDALITYRYAHNLATGQGFVYNLGERVLGTTTPLYTLILALAELGGLSAFVVGPALNLLADAGAVVLVGLTLRRWGLGMASLGMAFAGLFTETASMAVSGMETGIYTFVNLLALYLFLKGRHMAWAATCAAAVLIRPDAAAVLGVLALAYVIQLRRLPVRELGLVILLLAPWFAFAMWYFGSPLPNSVAAKTALYSAHSPVLNESIDRLAKVYLSGSILSFGALRLGLAALGVAAAFTIARPILPYVAWFGVYYAAMVASRTHLHPWYIPPPLPVYAIMTVLGLLLLVTLAQRLSLARFINLGLSRRSLLWIYAPAILAIVVLGTSRMAAAKTAIAEVQANNDQVYKAVGLWLRENAPREARIYLEPIGYVGYFSERNVLDAAGLVTPQFVPLNAVEGYVHCLKINKARPEYVLLRAYEVREGGLSGCEEPWKQEYALVKEFLPPPELNADSWPGRNLFARLPR